MSAWGQSRLADTPPAVAACPLRAESGQVGRRFAKSALCHRADVPGLPRFRPLLGKEPIFSTNLRALWQLDFPLDSCNGNLREERIHRNYAKSPGGMPRRVFRCALARAAARGVVFAKNRKIQERTQPMKVLPTSSPLAHGKTTAGRRTPLFPIDRNNGSLN
jgi:hypothetical protein